METTPQNSPVAMPTPPVQEPQTPPPAKSGMSLKVKIGIAIGVLVLGLAAYFLTSSDLFKGFIGQQSLEGIESVVVVTQDSAVRSFDELTVNSEIKLEVVSDNDVYFWFESDEYGTISIEKALPEIPQTVMADCLEPTGEVVEISLEGLTINEADSSYTIEEANQSLNLIGEFQDNTCAPVYFKMSLSGTERETISAGLEVSDDFTLPLHSNLLAGSYLARVENASGNLVSNEIIIRIQGLGPQTELQNEIIEEAEPVPTPAEPTDGEEEISFFSKMGGYLKASVVELEKGQGGISIPDNTAVAQKGDIVTIRTANLSAEDVLHILSGNLYFMVSILETSAHASEGIPTNTTVTENNGSLTTIKTTEASETPEVPEVSEVPETPEVPEVPEVSEVPAAAACGDFIDNDNDGDIDMSDDGCLNKDDNDESDDPVQRTVADCADGIDNDGDGATDMGDIGCQNDIDDNEANPQETITGGDNGGGGGGGGGGSGNGGNVAVIPDENEDSSGPIFSNENLSCLEEVNATDVPEFADIEDDFYAKDIVETLASLSYDGVPLTVGYEENGVRTFGKDKAITRAEALKLLMYGLCELDRLKAAGNLEYENADFKDVKSEDWFSDLIAIAEGEDIVNGYADKTFKPNENITRAELAKILVDLADVEPSEYASETYANPFLDVSRSDWYYNVTLAAFYNDIAKGYQSGEKYYFNPDRAITRTEAAVMIYNYYVSQL